MEKEKNTLLYIFFIINGKRNGKGREYNIFSKKIIFEGEYLNGKRNGKGIEYYSDGKIKFEGVFNNGGRWEGIGYDIMNNKVYELKNGEGYIKEYEDGKLKFEGEYINGKTNGKGKEYNSLGKLRFEGEYLYSHKLRGKYLINDKSEYEGEYLYDKKWNGKGYDKNGNILYELQNGTGKVKEYYFNYDLIFEGEYLNGKRNGKGKEYNFIGKLLFEGEYLNGKRNGKGKEYDCYGKLIFEGEYLNGIKVLK